MKPVLAAYELSGLFWISWLMAAGWTRRTVRRPVFGSQGLYSFLAFAGFAMLFGSGFESGAPYYSPLPWTFAWALVGCVAAGFGFCWWARIHLGSLWSGTITAKAGHRVVDTGPYRLVRHPIYTGLIFSCFALAFLKFDLIAFGGAVLWAVSCWIKARMEESLLRQELGAAAYDDYAARTPMLIPKFHR